MPRHHLSELDIYLTELIELLVEKERARRFDTAMDAVCQHLAPAEADKCREEVAKAAAHWGAFVIDTAIALSGFVYRHYDHDRSSRSN